MVMKMMKGTTSHTQVTRDLPSSAPQSLSARKLFFSEEMTKIGPFAQPKLSLFKSEESAAQANLLHVQYAVKANLVC